MAEKLVNLKTPHIRNFTKNNFDFRFFKIWPLKNIDGYTLNSMGDTRKTQNRIKIMMVTRMVTKMVTKMVFKTRAWARPGLQNMAPAYCFAKPGPFLSSRYLVGREKIKKKKNCGGGPSNGRQPTPLQKKNHVFLLNLLNTTVEKWFFFWRGVGC